MMQRHDKLHHSKSGGEVEEMACTSFCMKDIVRCNSCASAKASASIPLKLHIYTASQCKHQCLPTYLIKVNKFDVMTLDDVYVGDLQPLQGLVYTLCDPLSREVKMVVWLSILPGLCCNDNLFTRKISQSLAKDL